MPIAMIHCDGCGYDGEVEYTTKRPEYCGPACRQKAYRRRHRKDNGKTEKPVTNPSPWAGVRYSDGVALVELVCRCDRQVYVTPAVRKELLYRPITCEDCGADFRPAPICGE